MEAKKIIFLLLVIFIFGGVSAASPALALARLVKVPNSPVVYYFANQTRHVFPNEKTFKTWYDDFSQVREISLEQAAAYPLGKNMTVRPGVNIVTFATDSHLYAVEPGGTLRKIKDSQLAEKIYGHSWSKKVIKLPDSFFNDYVLGEDISEIYQLPIGIVYKSTFNNKYYYNDNNLAWPFKDFVALKENNFKEADAVISEVNFEKRKREIKGRVEKFFDPLVDPKSSTADCENRKFKVAFILAAKTDYSQLELDKLNNFKTRLAQNFKLATGGLAELDVSSPVAVLNNDPLLFFTDTDGQLKPDNEIVNTFYDQQPDVFDFIIIYNNFVSQESVLAKYFTVSNDFLGTGNSQMHIAYVFGSRGKLKGIANMGNLNKYSDDSEASLNQSVNYIIHELTHHFSGRASFIDEAGNPSTDLLTKPNFDHWSPYLDAASPLGGSGWQDNGDGTFTNKLSLDKKDNFSSYSNLDLYFMGLLPKMLVAPIKYLVPDDPDAHSNTTKGELKQVTIDKIIEVMGEWRCRLE